MKERETRGARPGERRAYKEDRDDINSSCLHMRCMRAEKAAWVRASNARKIKLSEWVREQLNKAASQ